MPETEDRRTVAVGFGVAEQRGESIAKTFADLKLRLSVLVLKKVKKGLNRPTSFKIEEWPRQDGAIAKFETTDSGDLPVDGSAVVFFGASLESEQMIATLEVNHPQRGGGRETLKLGGKISVDEAARQVTSRLRELGNLR